MIKHLPALSLLFAAAQASAQLVYEPFGYTPASILDGQINPGNGLPWSKMSANPGTDDDILVANSNLAYSGLSGATGASVTYGGTGASERLSLGQDFNSGTFYYSMVFQLTSAASPTSAYIAGFSNFAGTSNVQPLSVGTRLFVKQGSSASTFKIGVTKNSNNDPDVVYGDPEYALNTPILVVGSYEVIGTGLGSDDIAKLYINPQASDFGAAAAPTVSTLSSPIVSASLIGTDLININNAPTVAGFVLRQAATGTMPNAQVDELRVDRTWAQVTPPVGISWNVDSSGAWSEDGKWSTAARPNNASAFVNFTSIAGGARSINVDGTYALRTINFTGNGPYTLNGGGTLSFSSSSAINVMAGNHTISATVSMGGDLVASVRSGSTLAVTGTFTSNGNSLNKAGAGTLQLANARVNQLNITGGKVQIVANGAASGVSKVNALNIGTTTVDDVTTYTAALDLSNNAMAIDYPVGQSPIGTWNGTAYTGILGAVQSGRDGGAWNGTGIITSQSAASAPAKLTTIGVAEASSALRLSGSATAVWRGQTVDATSLLIGYTYAGDADLDAKIDADDYFLIDRSYGHNGSVFGYGDGDFNYDGQINGDDYFIIDSGFVAQNGTPLAPLVGVESVPEPSGMGLVIFATAATLLRRSRRCVTSN